MSRVMDSFATYNGCEFINNVVHKEFIWTVLVGNQLVAQFLLCYVYLNPLHVSSNYVLILRMTIV
jgi:hypothetical protein